MSSPATADPANLTPQPARFAALDGLRGVAILSVLLFHFGFFAQSVDPVKGLASAMFALFDLGWLGVDLFFVLSGFLITGILLKSKRQPHYFKSFYARRALRIFPAYYALLGIAFVLTPILGHPILPGWPTENQAWLWFYGANIPIHQNWLDFSHLWTLAVEEHFYFIWPLVVYRLEAKRLRQVCLLTIPIALLVRFIGLHSSLEGYTMHFTLGRFDSLAIGALAATIPLHPSRNDRRILMLTTILTIVSLGLLTTCLLAPSTRSAVICFGSPIFAGSFAGLVFLASARGLPTWTMTMMESSVLGRVGKYSYGIYLFHLPVLRLSATLSISLSTLLGKLTWITAMGFISYAAAFISWHVWERWFLYFKTRFTAS